MNTYLDCIPCFLRQALEAARFATTDKKLQEQLLRYLLKETAEMDLNQSPPAIGQKLHRTLRQLIHNTDPYLTIKRQHNNLALKILPGINKDITQTNDPLHHALRLAISGNAIDLGTNGDINDDDVKHAIKNRLNEPFKGNIEEFRSAIQSATNILYLADNAGEIIFDRLLIEQLPLDRTTVAVRGAPVLNDALREDAVTAGLCDLVDVIDNGSDAPGTILTDCSDEFRKRYKEADLIIAKGQGNFETLSHEQKNIYFLFKVKCSVIGAHVGSPMGTHLAIRSKDIQSDRLTCD